MEVETETTATATIKMPPPSSCGLERIASIVDRTVAKQDEQYLESRLSLCASNTEYREAVRAIAHVVCECKNQEIIEHEKAFLEIIGEVQQQKAKMIESCMALYNKLLAAFEAREKPGSLYQTDRFVWSRRGYYAGEITSRPSIKNWLKENDPFGVIGLFTQKLVRLGYHVTARVSEPERDITTGQYKKIATYTLSCERD